MAGRTRCLPACGAVAQSKAQAAGGGGCGCGQRRALAPARCAVARCGQVAGRRLGLRHASARAAAPAQSVAAVRP
eukprot:7293635-Lingulodinium_polyedra.AAC.1